MENEVIYIKLDDIIPNRFQPREVFDEKALNELADSIRQHGVIEPIIVRPVANKFEIIAGERRYKASAIAGLTKIPALVKPMDDKESSLVAFIENEHRRDVSAIEKARTSERLLKNNNMTQEELASSLGISQSTLANRLRLLDLPLEVQESLMRNEISERHARSLLSVKDPLKQIELLNQIKEKRMTVRELESEIKAMNNGINNNQNMNNSFLPNNGMMNNQNNYNMDNSMNNSFNQFNNNQPNNMNNYNSSDNFTNYLNNSSNIPSSNYVNQNNNQNDADTGFMEFLKKYDDITPTPVSEPKTVATPVSSNMPNNNGNNMNSNNMGFMNNIPNNRNNNMPQNNYEINDGVNNGTSNMNNQYNNYPENNSYEVHDSLMNNQSSNYNQPNNYSNPTNNSMLNQYNNYENNDNNDNNGNNGGTSNFMNFLNNYDNSNPLPDNFDNEPINNTNNYQETNYLNNYSNNNVDDYNNINNYNNFSNDNSGNLMLNNVNPPITSNFNNNSYVEDNPNYTDVSQNIVLDSVDDIIEDLKMTINRIKGESRFKIDTDEINFDDMYQITIKIDKRDF